jgi:hypothetical protein
VVSLSVVSSIGSAAFRDCANLTMVDLGMKLELIEFQAFRPCRALETIDFHARDRHRRVPELLRTQGGFAP